MQDDLNPPSVPPVPPGSTPLRELCGAIATALTLSAPATQRDELTYLRIMRDRARLALLPCRKTPPARGIGAEARDVMIVAALLRARAARWGEAPYAPPR